MTFSIRLATQKDLPKCSEILVEEFLKQGEGWTLRSASARLAELMERKPGLCFCIELDGKVIGFVFAERFTFIKGKYLWISEFAIEAGNQGRGFGERIITAAFSRATLHNHSAAHMGG